MAPVAECIEVAQVERLLQADRDARQSARDLAGHEGLAADRRLVVEENPVAGEQAIGFPVIDGDPVGVELGNTVG